MRLFNLIKVCFITSFVFNWTHFQAPHRSCLFQILQNSLQTRKQWVHLASEMQSVTKLEIRLMSEGPDVF